MKQPKSFDFKKKPIKPTFIMSLAKHIISFPDLKKRGFTYEKIGMDELKPPYLLLVNHSSMVDFNIMLKLTHPYPVNNVMTLEGFHDYTTPLMRSLGVLGKRKFIQDTNLIKNIRYCLKELKSIFVLFPEARYSLDGTTSFLPESLGKLCKMMKVPVVVINIKGNFVSRPQWNKINKKKRVHATMTQIITKEEAESLSADEMNARIENAFRYDDYAWQKEQGLVIDHPERAKGLHCILYQCPHCKTEFKMNSGGTELWCEECEAKWHLSELGELQLLKPEQTELNFTHVPDWFAWERANVRKEIEEGTYAFEDEVRLFTLPNAWGFKKQPNATLRQDVTGTYITGTAYGQEFKLYKSPAELESMHIEYDYKGHGDCVDISTENDSFWCYPVHAENVISKLSIATEELYLFAKREREKGKSLSKQAMKEVDEN